MCIALYIFYLVLSSNVHLHVCSLVMYKVSVLFLICILCTIITFLLSSILIFLGCLQVHSLHNHDAFTLVLTHSRHHTAAADTAVLQQRGQLCLLDQKQARIAKATCCNMSLRQPAMHANGYCSYCLRTDASKHNNSPCLCLISAVVCRSQGQLLLHSEFSFVSSRKLCGHLAHCHLCD
jgi:hypothetical protein